MVKATFRELGQGSFSGEIRENLFASLDQAWLAKLGKRVLSEEKGLLSEGRHRVVVIELGEGMKLAVKAFGKQGKLKDRYDRKRGSKASRSFRAAAFLKEAGAGTPEPLGYAERWEGAVLRESYYFSAYLEGLSSFKDELVKIYREQPECDRLVSLLEHVAPAIRRMHDAGFWHRDLGNQNIELEPQEEGETWGRVNFIDLNRGRMGPPLGMKERAQDFSRIRVPGAFFEILLKLYWEGHPPKKFLIPMEKLRRRFRLWEASRRWRHPFRKAQRGPGLREIRGHDTWVWDHRSAQASVMLNRAERRKAHPNTKYLHLAKSVLAAARPVLREYRTLLPQAFSKRVPLAGKIGVGLEMADLDLAPQLAFLEELGPIPVLLRFCHHEGEERWRESLAALRELREKGHPVRVAILQDRRAVLEPESWASFLGLVLPALAGVVEGVEICHAVNRSKWGIHTPEEQAQLLEPVVKISGRYPELKITGPACIDFEYHFVLSALDKTPEGLRYDALSHHLYVDRRGAPENKQGKFGTVEKCALLKAIASYSPHCEDRVIISEVNWPVKGSGIYSPVDATFMLSDQKENHLNVSEQDYGNFMLRYLVLALCSGFIDQVNWWRLVSHGFGLVDERADGGWTARPAFQMLKFFLETLGEATFVEKLATASGVYALRFETAQGEVVMGWANGKKAKVTWPTGGGRRCDASGVAEDSGEVGDGPCYFFSPM